MNAADTADLRRITEVLTGEELDATRVHGAKELDAGQIAVMAQLPVSRVVRLLGPRCGPGGLYLRRDVGGVYMYSLESVAQPPATTVVQSERTMPFDQAGRLIMPSAPEPPPQELVSEGGAQGINPQQRFDLFALLKKIEAPPQIIQALSRYDYGAVIGYVTMQKATLAEQERRLKEIATALGQLEEILKAA